MDDSRVTRKSSAKGTANESKAKSFSHFQFLIAVVVVRRPTLAAEFLGSVMEIPPLCVAAIKYVGAARQE